MQDAKLKKLEEIFKLADQDYITHEEFEKIFERLTEVIQELKSSYEKMITDKFILSMSTDVVKSLKKQIEEISSESQSIVMSESEKIFGNLKTLEDKLSDLSKSKVSMSDMSKALKDILSEVSLIKRTIPTMPDLMPIKAEIEQIKASIPEIKEEIEETPEETRDKLESIDEEDEKLSIEAIKDLRKELDELRKKISFARNVTIFGGGGGGLGKSVKAYDLSSQLNGVLKTFTIPANYRVISVHSSSFPFVLRPTTDYTVTTSSITFTSEIEASTTLSTGQSIIIIYAE